MRRETSTAKSYDTGFTDPVYSGKAFHGMLDEIRKGIIPQGSTVVYLHTGGTVALFSEPEIIGDLNEDIA